MLIAIASDKGSPGASTTALALASAWSTPAVVVEADPGGGDLGLRLRTSHGEVLPETPTVLTLLTAARSAEAQGVAGEQLVARYAQVVNEQLSVVPAPLLAEQQASVVSWSPVADVLAAGQRQHFLDVGRLHAASPLLPCVSAAEVIVMVARAEAGSMIRLRERLSRIMPALAAQRAAPPRLFPVLVGRERHASRDREDLAWILQGTPAGPLVVGSGHLAFDVAAAERIWAGQSGAGRLARTALMRSARRIAEDLAMLVEPVPAPASEVAR